MGRLIYLSVYAVTSPLEAASTGNGAAICKCGDGGGNGQKKPAQRRYRWQEFRVHIFWLPFVTTNTSRRDNG
ncbi:hypothetical protein EDC04DRAFT_2713150 [Pisolithus marmoratus]|nr:hypothetical protein EDC04DRAFT_2713150 [Pisolithus marmoratus]